MASGHVVKAEILLILPRNDNLITEQGLGRQAPLPH